MNDKEIYIDYMLAKVGGVKDRTAVQIAASHGITRDQLYDVIERMEKGNMTLVNQCLSKSRADCLWEFKYKPVFDTIPKNRTKESVILLRRLICRMKEDDDFNVSQIARKVGKDRSTVIFHLK